MPVHCSQCGVEIPRPTWSQSHKPHRICGSIQCRKARESMRNHIAYQKLRQRRIEQAAGSMEARSGGSSPIAQPVARWVPKTSCDWCDKPGCEECRAVDALLLANMGRAA